MANEGAIIWWLTQKVAILMADGCGWEHSQSAPPEGKIGTKWVFPEMIVPIFEGVPQWPRATSQLCPFGQASDKWPETTTGPLQMGVWPGPM